MSSYSSCRNKNPLNLRDSIKKVTGSQDDGKGKSKKGAMGNCVASDERKAEADSPFGSAQSV
jgi:hypothetical protein